MENLKDLHDKIGIYFRIYIYIYIYGARLIAIYTSCVTYLTFIFGTEFTGTEFNGHHICMYVFEIE